ncbi:hypothetical protein SISNIDRAFT_448376 [Sistotremastrum niveocremeum HHB9708]|uniref:EthD domain-containing protein n=1 Tax=Sistotremastrum niveocremeum HHB9708 TaxID=1314777 RepID=A0A164ZXS0_9AGAM|nr:hypothetical protein SISNIDRAFT_448376 [Sistotremastrum niveocremeum HHB9708]
MPQSAMSQPKALLMHVPLRTQTPGFLSAQRYQEIDGAKPTWNATYDLESLSVLDSPGYQKLGTDKSEHEISCLARLAVLDRRVFKLLYSAGEDPHGKATVVVFNSITPTPALESEFLEWYKKEHVPMLSKIPGWIRTRQFELVREDSGSETTPAWPPKLLTIHEWEDGSGLQSTAFKEATSTAWRAKVMEGVVAKERRVMKPWNGVSA